MFYFDVRPCIKRLTLEEKGQLFEAILDYGEFGNLPNFDDRLGIAWDFIQPKLNKDSELYGRKVSQRHYAVYVREARKCDSVPISFDEWSILPDDEKKRLLSTDTESYPTSTSTSTSTDNKAGKPPAPPNKHGEFGWVQLTQDEYTRLVADLGETEAMRCIAYVDESAQSTGNKNKWRDWNLVVRKCHRDGWGLPKSGAAHGGTPIPDYNQGGAEQWSL